MQTWDLNHWAGFKKASNESVQSALIDQVAIDTRLIQSGKTLFVALKGAHDDGHCYLQQAKVAGASFALVDERASLPPIEGLIYLKVPDPLQALQEIAHSYRKELPIQTIAITGSLGKTLCKDLLEKLLATKFRTIASPESFNSQLGVALSLLQIQQEHEIAIIEAGISNPGEMARLASMIEPSYAILTCLSSCHLATMKSMEVIAAEKSALLQQTVESGWILYPSDPLIKPYLSQMKAFAICFNESHESLPIARPLDLTPSGAMRYQVIFPDGLTFIHQTQQGIDYFCDLLNIALKAAWLLGVRAEKIIPILKEYDLNLLQTETWISPQGATFINGFYSASPLSLKQALQRLPQKKGRGRNIFVFGGLKSPSHSQTLNAQMARYLTLAPIDSLLLTGQACSLSQELKRLNFVGHLQLFETMKEAFVTLENQIEPKDTVFVQGPEKEDIDSASTLFSETMTQTHLVVNLNAIDSNLTYFKKHFKKPMRLMAIVKALGYGTDNYLLAQYLNKCEIDILGVAHVDEGVALKRSGISQAIFAINCALYEIEKAVHWQLELGVDNQQTIKALEKEGQKQNKKIKLHLHVDTGMTRLGCPPDKALELARAICRSSHLQFEGLMTHFACADDPSQDQFTLAQIDLFVKISQLLQDEGLAPVWYHTSNTAGATRFTIPFTNMARIGLGLFGIHPSIETKTQITLQPALSLTSKIAGINVCKKGETISYGRTYTAQRDFERIGVVPVGYFDGLHRHYSGKGHVIVRGQRAPMVGLICMDYMMIDISDIPDASIGDLVLIFGRDKYGNTLAIEDFATRGQTTAYELMTCLGPRIQRIFIENER